MRLPVGASPRESWHPAWRIPLFAKDDDGGAGIVYAPEVVRINCAFHADGGSMIQPEACKPGAGSRCLPGCSDPFSVAAAGSSLETQMTIHLQARAWPTAATRLSLSLSGPRYLTPRMRSPCERWQGLHAAEHAGQDAAMRYNEVIIDGASIAADAAHAVSAFIYRVSSDSRPWDDHFASDGRLKATRAREAYLRAYPERPPEDVPLLSLDTAAWDAPFAEG